MIWADSKTQKDVCKILDNAKKCTNQNPGYEDKVFDADGKVGYESKSAESAVKVLFLIKGSISDMNIRMDWERIMQFILIGIYTVVEVKSGKGAYAWEC